MKSETKQAKHTPKPTRIIAHTHEDCPACISIERSNLNLELPRNFHMPCACKIVSLLEGETILFCPLHAGAPELLEALKRLALMTAGPGSLSYEQALKQAKEVAAKVEGK